MLSTEKMRSQSEGSHGDGVQGTDLGVVGRSMLQDRPRFGLEQDNGREW